MFNIKAYAESPGGGGKGGRSTTVRPPSEKRNGDQTHGQYIRQHGSLFGKVAGGTVGPRPIMRGNYLRQHI